MTLLQLAYAQIAPGLPYHAASQRFLPGQGFPVHTHDFWEVFLVLDGRGTHHLGAEQVALEAGNLCLVRAHDTHALEAGEETLHLLNVAFPLERLRSVLEAAQCSDALGRWTAAHTPPTRLLSGDALPEVVSAFQRSLRAFVNGPSALELCRVLLEVAPLLGGEGTDRVGAEPAWLEAACKALEREDGLRAGVPAMLEASGVRPEHLSRSFRRFRDQTPTEFVNAQRLAQAALRLLSSDEGILDVSSGCGFENASYFYRLFKKRYGTSPEKYRRQGRRALGG